MELVAADIGGTHVRFAIATIADGGQIALGQPVTLRTSDHADLPAAWQAFGRIHGNPLPPRAALAIAAPVTGDRVVMTNNSWVLHQSALPGQLGVDRVCVLNDFAAVAHAVACAPAESFIHVCGPDGPLPTTGTTSVIGPGTGLGVAHFHRHAGGYHVQATEGGHTDFAPVDALDDAMFAALRVEHGRVSTERIAAGPGILPIYRALATQGSHPAPLALDRDIWTAALEGQDRLAVSAMERYCMTLGRVAGDLALAHGAGAVVLAGGLGYRLRDHLPRSGFAEGFCYKGRYAAMMAGIPVKLITHTQPGLLGAAAAFAAEHQQC